MVDSQGNIVDVLFHGFDWETEHIRYFFICCTSWKKVRDDHAFKGVSRCYLSLGDIRTAEILRDGECVGDLLEICAFLDEVGNHHSTKAVDWY